MSVVAETNVFISRAANGWLIHRDLGDGKTAPPFVARDAEGAMEIAAQMLGVDIEVRR